MASIPSPYEKRWQAYLVPNKNDMASMFGPIFYQHGKHTWSLIFLTWQAYLVPKKTYMASIPSPLFHLHGKHTWSLLFWIWQACLVRNITFLANIVGPPLYFWMLHIKNFFTSFIFLNAAHEIVKNCWCLKYDLRYFRFRT